MEDFLKGMPGGDGFPDGEEENSSPGSSERAGQADQTNGTQDPSTSGSGEEEDGEERRGGESSAGCEESGGERSGGEQAQDDVDMNSGHDSSSCNDSVGGSRHHRSSSANCSPGSTTGSGSTKRYNEESKLKQIRSCFYCVNDSYFGVFLQMIDIITPG